MIQDGKHLRELRLQWSKEISGTTASQEKLASALSDLIRSLQPIKNGYSITQSRLSRWETGKGSPPSVLELLAYAYFFKVGLSSLLNPAYRSLCQPEVQLHCPSCPSDAESKARLQEVESAIRQFCIALKMLEG